MQLFLRMMALLLVAQTAVFFFVVVSEWNFQYTSRGMYVSPDGIVHRESQNEMALLLLVFSVIMLFVTVYFSFNKKDLIIYSAHVA